MSISLRVIIGNDVNSCVDINGIRQVPIVSANLFRYNNRFYDVPENFKFPERIKLRDALNMWLLGQSSSADGSFKIKPFKKIKASILPTKKLQNIYRLQWKPLFFHLDKIDDINIPHDSQTLTVEQINTVY